MYKRKLYWNTYNYMIPVLHMYLYMYMDTYVINLCIFHRHFLDEHLGIPTDFSHLCNGFALNGPLAGVEFEPGQVTSNGLMFCQRRYQISICLTETHHCPSLQKWQIEYPKFLALWHCLTLAPGIRCLVRWFDVKNLKSYMKVVKNVWHRVTMHIKNINQEYQQIITIVLVYQVFTEIHCRQQLDIKHNHTKNVNNITTHKVWHDQY